MFAFYLYECVCIDGCQYVCTLTKYYLSRIFLHRWWELRDFRVRLIDIVNHSSTGEKGGNSTCEQDNVSLNFVHRKMIVGGRWNDNVRTTCLTYPQQYPPDGHLHLHLARWGACAMPMADWLIMVGTYLVPGMGSDAMYYLGTYLLYISRCWSTYLLPSQSRVECAM